MCFFQCDVTFAHGTTRAPREEEISGVDYNFVSIQEFFSLEESGALLESGKFKGAMSKATVRKLHWRSKESFVPLGGASGELGVAIGGGADYGEFPFVTAAPGGGATVGDVILEIGATPVLGMTLGDLQQIIRENLYIRAVPCTTRAPREEEISGVDYNFVSIQEFFSLEESGALLESGKFKADILLYINGSCVLGRSHKEVVEMLQSVAMGTSVDVVLRRGYPMLYNPDGCPKQSLDPPRPSREDACPPGLVSHAPSQSSPALASHATTQLPYNTAELCNGNDAGMAQTQPSYAAQPITNGVSSAATPPPPEPTTAPPPPPSTDGTMRRSSLIGYSTSSLPAPSSTLLLHQQQQSSDRDLSSSTLPAPTKHPSNPTHAHPPCGFIGCPASHPSLPKPPSPAGPVPGPGTPPWGELVPVALGRSEGGLGFSVMNGGVGGHQAVVRRVWDRRQCPSLQTGDVITKINGADVLHLTFTQSTSFLDSVPVTLTLEPRDWLGVEESVRGGGAMLGAAASDGGAGGHGGGAKSMEVELNRRPGEGFGFVIASQNTNTNGGSCVMSHRFVTVRRGSPAARSGVIQPGDRLEGVEGRTTSSMSHRELAQILRRASNVLRLTVVPRSSSSSSEAAESDADTRLQRKGGRQRSKEEQWFYRVDLERGPTGFGFSLRGGSEYNMGLYVLALMEGGPAQRCSKIQISDQLVQINGGSTVGMTHGQAVEHIRRGGSWIHLVLRKGNGYVPDYGPEEEEEQSLASEQGRSTPPLQQRGGAERRRRSTPPLQQRGGAERRRRTGVPDLDLDEVKEEQGSWEHRSWEREGKEGREGREETERGRTDRKKGKQGEREKKHVLPSNHKVAFHFLAPLNEFSQSATSITSGEAGSERRDSSNWRSAELAWQQPGPWLEPHPHRLKQDLTARKRCRHQKKDTPDSSSLEPFLEEETHSSSL
ncbi:hypothetical protein CRUP_007380 [Coryphaenoides rupestris]|nr:hypothetical protein CRUP_007380 [Coryphaenoides rupestris]